MIPAPPYLTRTLSDGRTAIVPLVIAPVLARSSEDVIRSHAGSLHRENNAENITKVSVPDVDVNHACR